MAPTIAVQKKRNALSLWPHYCVSYKNIGKNLMANVDVQAIDACDHAGSLNTIDIICAMKGFLPVQLLLQQLCLSAN